MYIPVLIVGSGIGGMSTAYYLKKKNISYVVITKERKYQNSNSTIAPANIRIFDDSKYGVEWYMQQCNGNLDTIKAIYDNQVYITDLLKELKIETRNTNIGVIPNEKHGGKIIIEKLYKQTKENILTNLLFIDFKSYKNYTKCLLYNQVNNQYINVICNALVVATGGFSSIFKYNDNSNVATGESIYLLDRETNCLKGTSTIMVHPFGILNGKLILTGDIVSQLEKILYENEEGKLKELKLKEEVFKAIKEDNYRSNEMFCELLQAFREKKVYLRFPENEEIKNRLKNKGLSQKLLKENIIKITPTAHYTSGGIVVDKNFKVQDRIFANGEIIFDGDKGIGRLPGHPFACAIIGGKIIANEIEKLKINEISDDTQFEIIYKISKNNEKNYETIKKIYLEYLEKISNIIFEKFEEQTKNEIDLETMKKDISNVFEKTHSVKELQLYYRLNLLYKIVEDFRKKEGKKE